MQENPKVKFNTSRNSSNTSSDTNGNDVFKENTHLISNSGMNKATGNFKNDDVVLEKLPEELFE